MRGTRSVVLHFMRTKSVIEPALGKLRMAGTSSLTDSRLLSTTALGRRTLMLPIKPPTRFRRDSPEMAGLMPDKGVDGLLVGGEVTLTERPRNSMSSPVSSGFRSMASEAERLRNREISSWILPALKTAPGIEAIFDLEEPRNGL